MKARIVWFAALAFVVAATACQPEVSSETRAGDWKGSTAYGSFTFTLTPDGTAIADVEYFFRCGENAISSANYRMGDPVPLQGRDLEFGVALAGQVPMAVWKGTFSRDGQTLAGKLEILAGLCETDFEITR